VGLWRSVFSPFQTLRNLKYLVQKMLPTTGRHKFDQLLGTCMGKYLPLLEETPFLRLCPILGNFEASD
jgi:hypothetical protein